MSRRTCVALSYSGTVSRWVHVPSSRPEGKLWRQCVWQPKPSAAARVANACERLALTLPGWPCDNQPEPGRRQLRR